LQDALTGPVTANFYYDHLTADANPASDAAQSFVQTRRLRTYATWTFAAFVALTASAYLAASVTVELSASALLPVTAPTMATWFVLGLAALSAVMVGRASSHVAGVLTLSILGFMVAIFYILGKAPDLALTQLVVETLVLVIFLLVLDHLPAFYGEVTRTRAVRDGLLSVAVGGVVATTVLLATTNQPTDPVAQEFVDRAVPEAGGGNIVNVILVDFRAFDTLGESLVIVLAAISVLVLLAMRTRGERQ
jgi:multicomponent Na+:H+ antiporter subunit A